MGTHKYKHLKGNVFVCSLKILSEGKKGKKTIFVPTPSYSELVEVGIKSLVGELTWIHTSRVCHLPFPKEQKSSVFAPITKLYLHRLQNCICTLVPLYPENRVQR